jgi:hypothetical protein
MSGLRALGTILSPSHLHEQEPQDPNVTTEQEDQVAAVSTCKGFRGVRQKASSL